MPIKYFSEEISFHPESADVLSQWVKRVCHENNHSLGEVNYIFCSDGYLRQINQTHLSHDYYTDIITFPTNDSEYEIAADIFISIDRVRENASEYSETFHKELHRVMIHGILHLIGYGDNTEAEKQKIRQKENDCLETLEQMMGN